MKSPFPGMDPYLEDPRRWSSVHTRLINALSDQLTERLLPDYYVEIEQRVYIVSPDTGERWQTVPDVFVVPGRSAGATPTGAITPAVLVEPVYEPEVRERYLEIRDTQNRELVATIELLSPFNKTPHTQGYQAFLEKRRQVMQSPVHWLEIDLLRRGHRPDEVAGKSDYYALLKRGGSSGPYEVWYFNLRDAMPTVALPLREPHEDVPLDLQAAFADMYARAGYGVTLDYSADVPSPPLAPADVHWVRQRVKARAGE